MTGLYSMMTYLHVVMDKMMTGYLEISLICCGRMLKLIQLDVFDCMLYKTKVYDKVLLHHKKTSL